MTSDDGPTATCASQTWACEGGIWRVSTWPPRTEACSIQALAAGGDIPDATNAVGARRTRPRSDETVLGLAYHADIHDIRLAPSLTAYYTYFAPAVGQDLRKIELAVDLSH